jgi:high-affinity iron transporter
MILGGALSACAALAAIAGAMVRYSRQLPIGKFFTYSSWLMAVLTVVLTGKGIAALQEAGIVSIAPLRSVPRISLVGLFPTTQTVAAQALMIVALTVGFAINRRRVA